VGLVSHWPCIVGLRQRDGTCFTFYVKTHLFSLPISTFSALGVFHVMRYINVRYLLTYLLTYGLTCECCIVDTSVMSNGVWLSSYCSSWNRVDKRLGSPPQGNQEPLVVKDTVRRSLVSLGWASPWNVILSALCSDAVGWVTGMASGP